MSRKIICRPEADKPSSGDNGVVDYSALDRLLVAARRQLSRPASEQVASVVLTLLAVYEASRFESYEEPLNRSGVIVVSLVTLVPVVLWRARPALAAAAATLLTITFLRTGNPALTVVSMCIALFLVAHLVVRRGLPVAVPLLIPFFVVTVVRLTGPYNALGSTAPLLFKDAPPQTLFDAVRVVAAGEALLAPTVTRRLIAEFARLRPPQRAHTRDLDGLTPREIKILSLVAAGLSNQEIADRLVLSNETVKTHVSHILRKLGLRDRAQAVVAAYETGLVTPAD